MEIRIIIMCLQIIRFCLEKYTTSTIFFERKITLSHIMISSGMKDDYYEITAGGSIDPMPMNVISEMELLKSQLSDLVSTYIIIYCIITSRIIFT